MEMFQDKKMNSKIILGIGILLIVLSGCTQLTYPGLPQNLSQVCNQRTHGPIYECESNNLEIKYKKTDSPGSDVMTCYFNEKGNEIKCCGGVAGLRCDEIYNSNTKCEKLIC